MAERTWTAEAVIGIVVRALVAAAVMAALFGMLAVLASSHRVANGGVVPFNPNQDHAAHAWLIGRLTVPMFLFLGLIVEINLVLLKDAGVGPMGAKRLVPALMAGTGAILGIAIFQTDPFPGVPATMSFGRWMPKDSLLIAGAMLATFLGSALQLCLHEYQRTRSLSTIECPGSWLAIILILAAVFVGGLRGWTGDSPEFHELLKYRLRAWTERSVGPGQPAPFQPPPPVIRELPRG
jgi:hypothetical protein